MDNKGAYRMITGTAVAAGFTCVPAGAFSRLGMILLTGLSAKNAILIVEFSREAHDWDGRLGGVFARRRKCA